MSLRIGTWNLDHARGVGKDAARLDTLRQHDADVWVLTETNDRVSLPGYAAVHSTPRAGSKSGGRWVTIWSRLPIQECVAVADGNRCAAALIWTFHGALLVFGTVLPWHADAGEPPREPRTRNWEEQYRVTAEQGREWIALRAAYPGAELCVAGDLNMSLGGPRFYGTARGRAALTEAMAAAELVCTTSFDRMPAGALQNPAIDHILLSPSLAGGARVAAAWEGHSPPGPRLSDHSGVLVAVD